MDFYWTLPNSKSFWQRKLVTATIPSLAFIEIQFNRTLKKCERLRESHFRAILSNKEGKYFRGAGYQQLCFTNLILQKMIGRVDQLERKGAI